MGPSHPLWNGKRTIRNSSALPTEREKFLEYSNVTLGLEVVSPESRAWRLTLLA
jgi:hypothetical protein